MEIRWMKTVVGGQHQWSLRICALTHSSFSAAPFHCCLLCASVCLWLPSNIPMCVFFCKISVSAVVSCTLCVHLFGCVLYNLEITSCICSLWPSSPSEPTGLRSIKYSYSYRSSTLCPPYLWSWLSTSGVRQIYCFFFLQRFISSCLKDLCKIYSTVAAVCNSVTFDHQHATNTSEHGLVFKRWTILCYFDWICLVH